MASSTHRPGAPREGSGQQPADLLGLDAGRTRRLPSVRLAPRDDLASLARVAPLLRAARDLDDWATSTGNLALDEELEPSLAELAASTLDLAPREILAAWRVVIAVKSVTGAPGNADGAEAGAGTADSDTAGQSPAVARLASVLGEGSTEAVLGAWDAALAAILASEELDGIATALYTVGEPVGIDGLFDAYASAAGPGRGPVLDHGAELSIALEMLADLAVVELGTEDSDGSLTVALSPLGTWGLHRRLRAQGWHVPVLGAAARHDAQGLLSALAVCDAEDGEAEITAWLAARVPTAAAAELIAAAAAGSPGQRGAAFAVLDRVGPPALDQVRESLAHPLLRAHAAVWLFEHGDDIELDPQDRTWLLVDLGAGLLEEANPHDVVAELLPDVPPQEQAEIVAGLWQVSHPGVTDLLTALSDHHSDPGVARAARKAAFKARSPAASPS